MKHFKYFLIFGLLSIFLFSCETTKTENNINSQDDNNLQSDDLPNTTISVEPTIITDYNDDEVVELLDVEDEDSQEEYLRSINQLSDTESVSKKEFSEDKRTILEIISELAIIMETEDCMEWINYIEPASLEYYKNPVNLRKAQRKLPNKTIELKNIEDYFKYIFIPSRKNRQIDEIRYISKSSIKAVQVDDDFSTIVFYYFVKVDGKWMVHLPEL